MDVKRYHINFALLFKKIGRNEQLCQIDEIWFDRRVKNAVAMDIPKEVRKQNYLHPSSYSIVYWLFISTARWMVRGNKYIRGAVVLLSEADVLKKNSNWAGCYLTLILLANERMNLQYSLN